MFDPQTLALAEAVLAACRAKSWRVATAEACTGGLLAAALTAIPGASDVVERGFVAYSNKAKIEMPGVSAETIAAHGAVSAAVAAAMAKGAVALAGVDLAVAITGLAGPGGGTPEKPVGLVYIGIATKNGAAPVERRIFPGDRSQIRSAALLLALELLKTAAPAQTIALPEGSGSGRP